MTNEEMIGVVNSLYQAITVGDWDLVAANVTDDIYITEADGLPMAGEYHGLDGYKQLFNKVFGGMDIADLSMDAMTAGDGHVIALATMHYAQEGLEPGRLAEVFRFRDGKVCQIIPYYYSDAAIRAAFDAKQAEAAE